MAYTADDYERKPDGSLLLNHYGQPIVTVDQYMELHRAIVPTGAGSPPWCSCGWTRWHDRERDIWIELCDHLNAMGEFADWAPQR